MPRDDQLSLDTWRLHFALASASLAALSGSSVLSREDIAQELERCADQLRREVLSTA